MATNTEKSLYQAPAGLPAAAVAEEPVEIEVILPGEDEVEEAQAAAEAEEDNFDANLALVLVEQDKEGVLGVLSSELKSDVDNDKNSRREWEKAYTDGLKLLGLQYEERTEPWDGACGVFHPMITEAVVRFQSETITETFPAQGPVRTKIIGKETPAKKEAAVRVEADMNYQLTEKMPEYRPEHEKMLWNLPAAGSAFKKVYYDPSLGRQVSVFIPAEDILLPYGTTDIQSSPRVTHRMRKTKNEILKLQKTGFYRELDIGEPTRTLDEVQKAKDDETGFNDLNDDRYELYEIHADLDIEGFEDKDDKGEPTGVQLPYVVTMLSSTGDILSIRRNWVSGDVLRLKRQHFVHYQYIPGFGAYGFGLFHLIGGFAKSATSIMRQLVDAGTLANLPGGLKSRGLRIKGDDTPIAPGEFRDVDVASGAIRDNILPLPYKEPSATLYNLLTTIVEEGRRFAATADMKVSDMSAQAPVGTTLALLERQLKVMTAVQARTHYSLKQELRLLAAIIRDYSDEDYPYEPDVGSVRAKRSDYSLVDVIPVSDPNAATMSQRVVQYQAVVQLSAQAPQIYNLPQLHRGMLEVLGIKNADKLVPLPEDQKPKDPVSENMSVLKLEPLKAFMHQDHESHIRVHMAAVQDPLIMQLIGQNPQAQAIQSAMMAHIAEHVGYAYRAKIEQQLGMALPPEETQLPPEMERALSSMMAQAAQQVLQQSQTQAAAQAAQQAAQDPIVQMQMQELELKKKEVELKEKKLIADAAAQMDKLDLEGKKVDGQMELEAARLGLQEREGAAKRESDDQREGLRIGADIAKHREQMNTQRESAKAAAKAPKKGAPKK